MCELFAMSSRLPATINLSLQALVRHCAASVSLRDGWGVVYYQGMDLRLIKEAESAADSRVVRFIDQHRLRSRLVLGHIRHATQGSVAYENTQPFARELGGRMHVFVHNGDLPGVWGAAQLPLGRFRPIGATDSEYVFCALLNLLEPLWLGGRTPPAIEDCRTIVAQVARIIRRFGPANFVYGDGRAMYGHAHRRRHPGREGYHPPGLHTLCRACRYESASVEAGGLQIKDTDDRQQVLLIASTPLSDEPWRARAEGEVFVVESGRVIQPMHAPGK